MTEEDQKAKILQQVEFYFSDSNLLNDKFLFTTQQANEGWVPISVISQFERMKKYRPIETIVEALRESKELLEVSENGELVKRKAPLPSNQNEILVAINKRSVVVNHLPEDATLDDLIKFFNTIGATNQVRMKKKFKKFTGSAVVEFKTEEIANKLLEQEEKLKYGETEVNVIAKVAYDESKAQEFGKRRGGKGKKSFGSSKRGRDHKRNDRNRERSPQRSDEPKDVRERDDEPKKSEQEESEKKSEPASAPAPAAEPTPAAEPAPAPATE
ncbi:unnamed protein product [Ambrosiozyma monospora]|uniref:Unnamed protein product n=1 Tax=Ambrosiozyma monospora TaxID=43982 RepID=A0ACB5T461_AMBMO|nr:unnamed protein product [Ambrosiozyma monospora]